MAAIIEVPNAFEPMKDVRKTEHPGGITVWDWVRLIRPETGEFDVPTVCQFNGAPLLRKDWGRTIGPDDVVIFISCVSGPFLVVIAIVIVIILLAVFFPLVPAVPGTAPASDPVYSFKGQSNEVRLGEPIECCYGRNRIYPSFAARPYYKYINNDQFAYSLFCIGQGEYSIEQILISDTDISGYQEVEYQVIGPDEQVTLFPTQVYSSIEVGDLDLLGPGQVGYVAPGWVGPFSANPPLTHATRLEFDLTFPKGLYSLNKKGNVQNVDISFEAEAQEIDNVGAPIGGYFSLTVAEPFTVSGATTTPQRRTFGKDVPVGRYRVRIRRVSDYDASIRVGNDAKWEGLRAFIDAPQNWGNVTLLAVKIRATNNLNNQTSVKFNVIATRKLPTYAPESTEADTTGWTHPVATRSIMWAFVDIFKSLYGGRLTDQFLALGALKELDDIYESRNERFDWIFRDPITVWEAARAVAAVGRAVPLLMGSSVTAKREAPQSIPVTMFTPENMLKDSFEYGVKFPDLDEYDSIRMEYTEQATGYKQETVMCFLPGGTNDHPQDVRFAGCQDRSHAFRDGMFMLAKLKYEREQIKFGTGLEGHLPIFGDLIAVSHDVPRWGQSGYVVRATLESGSDLTLTLSEPLDWSAVGEKQLVLRGKKGDWVGPFTAYQIVEDAHLVVIHMDDGEDFDFLVDGKTEPMLFLFGLAGNVTKYVKVVTLEPQGGESINVTAINYDDTVFSFDDLPVPELNQPAQPPLPPDLPVISSLVITQLDSTSPIIQAAWQSAFGAQYYVVQTSTDGENWEERAITTQTAVQLQVQPGDVWLRVAGVNNGMGPWIQDTLTLNEMSQLQLFEEWVDVEWTVGWWQTLNADGYQLKVYDNSGMSPTLKRTVDLGAETRSYLYDYAAAVTDSNLVREMLVTVDASYGGTLTGNPSQLALSNAIPSAPTAPASVFVGVDTDFNAVYHLSWGVPSEQDLITIKVWVSVTPGFDPSLTAPFWAFTAGGPGSAGIPASHDAEIALDTSGSHPQLYWRVAVFDVWGNEITTNVCAQQTIAAYP